MAVAVTKTEIEAAADWPAPPPFPPAPANDGTTIDQDIAAFELIASEFEANLMSWRISLRRHVQSLNDMIKRSADNGDQHAIERMRSTLFPLLIAHANRAVAYLQTNLMVRDEISAKMDLVAGLSTQYGRLGRRLLKRYDEAIADQHNIAVETYYAILAAQASIDPEADAGVRFDNPDELEKYLRSSADA